MIHLESLSPHVRVVPGKLEVGLHHFPDEFLKTDLRRLPEFGAGLGIVPAQCCDLSGREISGVDLEQHLVAIDALLVDALAPPLDRVPKKPRRESSCESRMSRRGSATRG